MGANNGKCLLDPERDCYGLIKARELEEEFDEFKRQNHDSHTKFFDRLGKLETVTEVQAERYLNITEKLADISESIAGIDTKIDSIEGKANDVAWMKEGFEKFDEELEEIKSKPAKRWESMWGVVAAVVITAIVTMLLNKIGL